MSEDFWMSCYFKFDFNDFVVYKGLIYGFDGGIFVCI